MTDSTVPSVVVLDDDTAVRRVLVQFLQEADIPAVAVSTAAELLTTLRDRKYAVACLDIKLRNDRTVGETFATFRELYPQLQFPDDEVREDFGLRGEDEVTGEYLLPMVKRISPRTEVVMVTSNWSGETEEGMLQKWQSYVTILKGTDDSAFGTGSRQFGLDDELISFVRMALKQASEQQD